MRVPFFIASTSCSACKRQKRLKLGSDRSGQPRPTREHTHTQTEDRVKRLSTLGKANVRGFICCFLSKPLGEILPSLTRSEADSLISSRHVPLSPGGARACRIAATLRCEGGPEKSSFPEDLGVVESPQDYEKYFSRVQIGTNLFHP